jgi:1,4-alpha-glucan branching enzyme
MESTLYRHLGAHLDTQDGVSGVRFHVWAPNASEVSVLCDLNSWMHGRHSLNSSDSGIWWGFVPGMKHGDAYKFALRTRDGH